MTTYTLPEELYTFIETLPENNYNGYEDTSELLGNTPQE